MIRLDDRAIDAEVLRRAGQCGFDVAEHVAAISCFSAETDRTGQIPAQFWAQLDSARLNRMYMPEQFGGHPAFTRAVDRVVIAEHLGYADPGYLIALPGPGLTTPTLTRLGSPQQQERYFAQFQVSEPRWAAFAISEPDAGSDATAIRTTATRTAHGYVLNGTKCFITNGARAQTAVIFASIDRSRGRFGVRAFMVDTASPGFSVLRTERMLGLRASQLTVLSLADCEVAADDLLGPPTTDSIHDGFTGATAAWDFMRPIISSAMVGTCRRIRDCVAEHYNSIKSLPRRRNRRLKLQQAIDRIDADTTSGRLLTLKAAWKSDQGLPMTADASMAKVFASEAGMRAAELAVDAIGIEALIPHSPLEKAYRDAKGFNIIEGTGDMQRLVITSLLRRELTDTAGRSRAVAAR